YRITDWLWKNLPDARIYSSGSVRFWFDAWHDLAEVGGGSEQGLLNGQVETAQWETNLAADAKPTVLWMQSLAADVIYVSDARSQEIFKDFQYPRKLDGVLPVLFDDGQGNVIYGVPRRYKARARVVDRKKLGAVQPTRFNNDVENLSAY